jgi:hypothetical protein
MQLTGPVPSEMYHRYVEFKPFVGPMFLRTGLRGRILNRALRYQHTRVYNYDRQTEYGCLPEPSRDLTLKFLEMVHFDQGGRIFTYVLTLGKFSLRSKVDLAESYDRRASTLHRNWQRVWY